MGEKVKAGTFVRIEQILLQPSERAPKIPDDTAKVPYMLWINGFLTADGETGNEVEIKSLIGRKHSGKLVRVNPAYGHDFGEPVAELLRINPRQEKSGKGGVL
ncbi:MAG: 2-amino-4-oxopentanoate thiolase subunit OrtA [Candidatus Wallbacteria bacterium]|nr:2-amino-4-oxopentanoate thiolase subunit OrtA [Candidatus Wallbacteria bacterium]